MLAGYLPFDDDPANPEGDNINLLYKYIVSTPLTFPVVALVTLFTISANGLNQLCLATSKRSARFLGSGTKILRSKSRA